MVNVNILFDCYQMICVNWSRQLMRKWLNTMAYKVLGLRTIIYIEYPFMILWKNNSVYWLYINIHKMILSYSKQFLLSPRVLLYSPAGDIDSSYSISYSNFYDYVYWEIIADHNFLYDYSCCEYHNNERHNCVHILRIEHPIQLFFGVGDNRIRKSVIIIWASIPGSIQPEFNQLRIRGFFFLEIKNVRIMHTCTSDNKFNREPYFLLTIYLISVVY